MPGSIQTNSVTRGLVDSSWVLLKQTPDTALVFKPQIHNGGVRGTLVKFKKERGQSWEKLTERSFVSLNLNEGVKIDLSTESAQKLYDAIYERKQIANLGVQQGEAEYITAPANQIIVIDDENKLEVINQLLENDSSNDFWNLLEESKPDLATRLASGHLQANRIKTINKLEERLASEYPETNGSDSWQKWVYSNNWLFGVQYGKPFEKTKINLSGSMPDYLFPTADGFLDVLEIKLPDDDVIVADSSHVGAYKWTPVTNTAIGQVVNYLHDIEHYRLELKEKILQEYSVDISIIRPRAFILIGNNQDWDQQKKDALRKLNYALHGIEVLTYHDLSQRGTQIANMYSV